jgi:hypothetical protein
MPLSPDGHRTSCQPKWPGPHKKFPYRMLVFALWRLARCECGLHSAPDNGTCVCQSGFLPPPEPTSGPYHCSRCTPACNYFASCYHPGVCRCRPPHVGDGVDDCYAPIPNISSVAPAVGHAGTVVGIKFVFPYPLNLSRLHVRFGDASALPVRRRPPIVYVSARVVQAAKVQVFASYDGAAWSSSSIFFEYEAAASSGRVSSSPKSEHSSYSPCPT